MSKSDEEKILAELKKITKLLVLGYSRDLNQAQSIGMMSKIGFQPKEIAELLGTTPNTVNVTLSKKRKKT